MNNGFETYDFRYTLQFFGTFFAQSEKYGEYKIYIKNLEHVNSSATYRPSFRLNRLQKYVF